MTISMIISLYPGTKFFFAAQFYRIKTDINYRLLTELWYIYAEIRIMVGENIQRLREIRGFTQEDMAKSLNMSLSAYGKIERNESGLSFDKAKAIAQILGVSISDLDEFDDKRSIHVYHHNTLHNCQQGETHITGGLADNEKALYEENKRLLEQRIIFLESELKRQT